MTYVTIRRQYLVITNGGHNCLGTTRGDAVIAPARKLKRVPDAGSIVACRRRLEPLAMAARITLDLVS